MRGANLLLSLLTLTCASGCGSSGKYVLTWTIAGETDSEALACSSHGIDGIQVQALRADSNEPVDLVVFPCAQHEGTRTLDVGDYVLEVSAISVRGQRLADPVTGEALPPQRVTITVTDSGTATPAPLIITPNPACSDGVDNDRDGLVDGSDPDCEGPLDDDEGPPAA